MRMEDDFRDLAPLRPSLDPQRWARMVEGIEAAAAPELARRATLASPGLLALLGSWTRPVLSAAALAAGLAGVALLRAPAPAEPGPGVGAALGYPDAVAAWVEAGWTPSVEELLVSLGES